MKLKDLQPVVGRSDLRVHCMSITCFSAGAVGRAMVLIRSLCKTSRKVRKICVNFTQTFLTFRDVLQCTVYRKICGGFTS